MKAKTNNNKVSKINSTHKASKSFAVGSHEGQVLATVPYTSQDVKNSILIVSIIINVFFLTLWLATQYSQEYAVTVANSILN